MNQIPLKQSSLQRPTECLARLAEPYGYRFDGDKVKLQAKFRALDHSADVRKWALQLWACPVAPTSGKDLSGLIVAEVALPPMSECADENEHMDMCGFAVPPAGDDECFMALVLAAGRPGQFNEVHDVAVFPRPERFVQPQMRGTVGYRVEGELVHLSIDRIENPRQDGNLSGTLALELWALSAPYAGGAIEGHQLAGTVIGSLSGGKELASFTYELPFTNPPAGTWCFTLALREWTSNGYVTRDFTNFHAPVVQEAAPVAAPVKTEPLVAVEAAPVKVAAVAEPVVKSVASTPVVVAAAPVAAAPAPVAVPAPKMVVAQVAVPTVKAAVAPTVAPVVAAKTPVAPVVAPAKVTTEKGGKVARTVEAAKAIVSRKSRKSRN